ncbi:MAG TPA: DNA-processing protein DprA [Candidatus Babeliales bacterium]|nr:DNA-processing protein DprA [Candidatus Babeliales bacterium]
MINSEFILHLTLLDTIGPAIIQKIIEMQRSDVSASDLYLFSQTDWMNIFGFTERVAQKLAIGLSDKKILENELHLIAKHTIQWLSIQNSEYPQLLREIYLPPSILYFQGNQSLFNVAQKSLSVVGARKADKYGKQVVDRIIPDLVAANYIIVSGGALGIDTMAHEVAIKTGGATIAVFGSGLLHYYPASNTNLFKAIIEHNGLIVSSFPLKMQPLSGNFPARNRIVTGLSHGCLVVQAAQKSGALISAHYAMEQGREVFAIPGPIDDELSVGCNMLIQNGAKLVITSADILQEFGDRIILPDKQVTQEKALQLTFESVATVVSPKKIDSIESSLYTSEQQKIIAACKQPSSFDMIIAVTQLSPEIIQSELFNLQLDGIVAQDFTGMWSVLS